MNTLLLYLETIQHCINKMVASIRFCISFTASNTYLLLSTKFCQQSLTLVTKGGTYVGMCWSRSTDTMHLLPHFIKKDVSKGGPVEETLMYDSQHTAKFEFSRPELRVRFWFL